MEAGPPSERDKISHSTPKCSLSSSRQSSNSAGRQGQMSKLDQSGYTNTFQSSSVHSRPVTAASRPAQTEESQNLDETGESTRSLLSVLSHSSVDSLSTGSITHSDSAKSSPEGAETRTESGREVGLDRTHSITNNQTPTNDHETEEEACTPSPWEKWLIEKSKLERDKIRAAIQKNLVEIEARRKKEEHDRERRRHVEEKVLTWLREKEEDDKKKRVADRKKKREERAKRQTEQQRTDEKVKAGREEWLSQKKEREQKDKERSEREKRDKALAERLRKEKAEEAFKRWKKESRSRPRPPTGSVYGKGQSSYSVPAFINPSPWRPIETSTPLNSARKKGSARKKPSAQNQTEMVVESPPLLFRDRSKKDNIRPPGRRR